MCSINQNVNDRVSCQDETVKIDHPLRLSDNESIEYINKVIEIIGDISVEDNASLRFHNCNVTVLWIVGGNSPHIHVSDRGRLSLENSSITIRVDLIPNYSTDGRISIEDHAVLNIVDSKIMCTSNVWMSIRDDSNAFFNGSEYFGKVLKSGLHRALEDKLPRGLLEEYRDYYSISVEVNASAIFTDSRIGHLGCIGDSNCIIQGSEIDFLTPVSVTETQVVDSSITILSASQKDSQFSFTGHVDGFFRDWSSRDFFGPDISSNVRLIDSSFDHLWLSLNNCTSVISDAELWILTVYQGELTVSDSEVWIMNLYHNDVAVRHSSVEYLVGECYDGELMIEECDVHWLGLTGHNREKGYEMVIATVVDSEIESCNMNYMWITDEVKLGFENVKMGNWTMIPAPRFLVDFKDCTMDGHWKIYSQRKYEDTIHMRGSIDFTVAEIETRPNLILIREYMVKVVAEEQPVWGAVVELTRGETVWKSGVTGMDGVVYFNVTWVEFGEDQSWIPAEDLSGFVNVTETLEIIVDEEKQTEVISIMSDTPVVLYTDKTPSSITVYAVGLVIILGTSAIVYKSVIKKRNLF